MIKKNGCTAKKTYRIKIRVTDIIVLLISILFFAGMLFWFGPCAPKDDGSFMACHWAGHAVTGIAAVLAVISLLHLLIADAKIKAGLMLASLPVSVLAYLVPGKLIDLCMMKNMRCHTVMVPSVTVCALLMIVAAAADLFVQHKKGVNK